MTPHNQLRTRRFVGVLTSIKKGATGTVGWIVTNEVGFGWWNKRGKDLVELRFVSENVLSVHPGDGVVFEWSGKCAIHVARAICNKENIQLALSYAKLNQYIAGTVTGWREKCDRHVLSLVIGDGEIDQETTMLVISSINEFLLKLPKRERLDVAYGWMMDRWFSPRMKEWLSNAGAGIGAYSVVKEAFSAFICSLKRTTVLLSRQCGNYEAKEIPAGVMNGKAMDSTSGVSNAETKGEIHMHVDECQSTKTVRTKYDARLYKKAADGFLQTLGKVQNNPVRTKRRLIWELIQNAKDVHNRFGKVSIRISLHGNVLTFSHNGDAFTDDDFIGLVQQTSSKDSQNSDVAVTGKFGTGFISTYLLSKKIEVNGVAKVGSRYKRFKTLLDRTAVGSEEMAQVFARDGDTVAEIFSDDGDSWISDYDKRSESDYDTSFVYRLSSEVSYRYAIEGINDLVNTLPITLVNQDRIKAVEVDVDGKMSRYSASRETANDSDMDIVSVSIDSDEGKEIRCYFSLRQDGVRVTAPFSETSGRVILRQLAKDTPKLLRDFPLIGSERFHFPYYLNGERFNPTEDRDGLYLNGEENLPAIENKKILETACEVALRFNEMLLNYNPTGRVFMAYSRKPEADMQERTPVWFEEVQQKWRRCLLQQPLMLRASDGEFRTPADLCLPFLHHVSCSPSKDDEAFYDLVKEGGFPVRGTCASLPVREEYYNWADVIERERGTWGELHFEYELVDLLSELSEMKTIADFESHSGLKHENAIEWLNRLIAICRSSTATKEAILKVPIFPDELGVFSCLKDLRTDRACRIPQSIRAAYDICCDTDQMRLGHVLLDPSIDVSELEISQFGMPEVAAALYDFWRIDAKARKSIPIIMQLLPGSMAKRDESKERRECVARLSKSFGYLSEDKLSIVDCDYYEIWDKADLIWAQWTVKSLRGIDEVPLRVRTDALKHLHKYEAKYGVENLGEYEIFPCQDRCLRQLNGLYVDSDIPETIKDMYDDCIGKSLRSNLLDESLADYGGVQKFAVKDVSTKLSELLGELEKKQDPSVVRTAVKILQVIPKGNLQYETLRQYADEIFDGIIVRKSNEDADGFDWKPAVRIVLRGMTNRIAEHDDLSALGKSCEWLDGFVQLVRYLDNGAYSSILEEDNSRVFVNQRGELCSKSNLYSDRDLKNYAWLKDLVAAPPISNDYCKHLLCEKSKSDELLSVGPFTYSTLTAEINKFFKDYRERGCNPEEENFRRLVFELNEHCKTDSALMASLDAYCEVKDALLSRSLGDKKMGMLYRLDQRLPDVVLEQLLSDEVNITDLIEALKNSAVVVTGRCEPGGIAPNRNGGVVAVSTSDDQYAGLSNDEKASALLEAKRMVRERLESENFVFEQGLCEKEFSIVNGVKKAGVEYPLVVHSYLNQSRQFQLNAEDWKQLIRPNSMLLVRTRQGVGCVPFHELIHNRERIDLSFSTKNLKIQERIDALASVMQWFTGLHFDFGSLIKPRPGLAGFFDLPERGMEESEKSEQLTPDDEVGVLP